MGWAEGGANKAGVEVGDLEAHSNKKSTTGGGECRMGLPMGGVLPMVATHQQPTSPKNCHANEPLPEPFQWITCTPRVAQGWTFAMRTYQLSIGSVIQPQENPLCAGYMSLAHVTIRTATLPQKAAIQDVTTTRTSLLTMWWQCWDSWWQCT
jgi:hypothetical protein